MNYRAAAEELREFVRFSRDLKGQWLVRTSKRLASSGEPYRLLVPTGHYNVY